MKQLFITLLIVVLILFCYWYITRTPDIIKVTSSISILDEKADENLFTASISGVAENTSSYPVINVWIIYKIEDEEVTAYIGELKQKQKIKFRTGSREIKINNPGYELVSIQFDK